MSEIVNLIENTGEYKKINLKIINNNSDFNYCGDNFKLSEIKEIKLDGLEESLKKYNMIFN